MLDDYGSFNYKGFFLLNFKIPEPLLLKINESHPLKEALYQRYLRDLNFDKNHHTLAQKGVTGITNIPFPHIDRKSTRLNSSHSGESRMPSSA